MCPLGTAGGWPIANQSDSVFQPPFPSASLVSLLRTSCTPSLGGHDKTEMVKTQSLPSKNSVQWEKQTCQSTITVPWGHTGKDSCPAQKVQGGDLSGCGGGGETCRDDARGPVKDSYESAKQRRESRECTSTHHHNLQRTDHKPLTEALFGTARN